MMSGRSRQKIDSTTELIRLMRISSLVLDASGLAVLAGGIYIGLAMHGSMSNTDWVLSTVALLLLGLVSTGLGVWLRHMTLKHWRPPKEAVQIVRSRSAPVGSHADTG